MNSCQNCSAELAGAFCHVCGQPAAPPATSAAGYVKDLLSKALGLESSLWPTVGCLLFRPGRLTAEYLAGRRARYVDPVQLYLLSAGAFFLVNAYRPFVRFDIDTSGASSRLGGASATGGMSESTIQRLAAQGISMDVFAERFDAWVSAYLPVLLLVLLAAFTGLIWLLNRRSDRPFAAHAIFTLHWSAFYLVTRGLRRVLPQMEGLDGRIDAAVAVVSLVYLIVAMRTVYQKPWWSSTAKAVTAFLAFGVLIATWMA